MLRITLTVVSEYARLGSRLRTFYLVWVTAQKGQLLIDVTLTRDTTHRIVDGPRTMNNNSIAVGELSVKEGTRFQAQQSEQRKRVCGFV